MPIIELTDVSKLYGFGDATTVALDEVNLSIEKGEFVAVMGPSGSGKSTLLNVIGLLDRPTHGTYFLDGQSVAKIRPNQRAKVRRDKIGFIFQSFNLLPRMTVLENVALPLAYKSTLQTRRLKRASTLLQQVGIQEKEYFYPRQLSGGQLQRTAIARALVNNPSIIIADEPTGNLDSASSRLVMELLSDIHKNGNTIIMVTHNPELTRYASRVLYMHDGGIVYDEQTAVGEVPSRARRIMYMQPERTEEDDLAGVSVLMSMLSTQKLSSKVTKVRKGRALKRAKKRGGSKS